MKESHREGVAIHPGPEPCEGGCEAALDALDRGICRLGIELRNRVFPGADGVGRFGRDALWVGIVRKKVNWVLDLDIRSFFDRLQHEWLVQFVEHRVGDKRVVRLIQKWLKAGVVEDGGWFETAVGSPQGAVISPILANLYLHYVLDVWVSAWRKKRFLKQLGERVRKFGLELHPGKTRLIEFGRCAAERREKRGEGKPEPWTFWVSPT